MDGLQVTVNIEQYTVHFSHLMQALGVLRTSVSAEKSDDRMMVKWHILPEQKHSKVLL